ncbi:hypothetical protein CYK65_14070 [Clostridium perfringens]|uniref:hypothetical protein n=1 Tax=Clostridium perfringens TaxID=1502 RepID=UPI000D70FF9B|nr:hypothetical protein [Clostridium perfringens]PWX17697.1 hypothetical protein CYK65_14070 [Clostridium perfringens]
MAGRRWTENDIEALCEMVGKYKIKTIAKRLDRTDLAVINKITKLRLGGGVSNAEGITINKLAQACCVGEGKVRRWIGKGLKAKKCIKYRSGSYTFIKIDDFWRFAFSNKELIDFSKIEKKFWVQNQFGLMREELMILEIIRRNILHGLRMTIIH